ncbi:MAG: hypothetical protein ACR2N5_02365, partial [Solirubrobacterales bacterium]
MIHVATIHHGSDEWIDIQLDYFRRNTEAPYRVWACLDYVDERHFEKFHFAEERRDTIDGELTFLTEKIEAEADADDVIVFTHGDTLPVQEWSGPVLGALAEQPLAGIRRDENLGEPHPQWCFTASSVGFWSELGSDWTMGKKWTGSDGEQVTDFGATLWADLEAAGASWTPMLRTSRNSPHPLWFGIYDGVIYHHGAAFRQPMSRLDTHLAERRPVPLGIRRRLELSVRSRRNARLSRRLYGRLKADPEFWR